MKKSHILAILIIATSIGIMLSSMLNYSSYASFTSAEQAPGDEFHVVGFLQKEKGILYEPSKNPNACSFFMKDTLGNERHVVLKMARPQDLDKSERIVVVGAAGDSSRFYASDIVLKCPSKYNDEKKQVAQSN